MMTKFRQASFGTRRNLRSILTCSLLLFASTHAASDASPTSAAPSTIAFSSAVQLESSLAWQARQIVNKPVLPLPKNITDFPEYEAVAKIAPRLPLIQDGIVFPEAEDMIANLVATTNATGPSIAGRDRRQSGLRVMVVGDSMTHGQQGDYTWRYRIWQFFRNNGIDVQFVGPYKGTMQPMEPLPPQPPPLYGQQAPDPGPQTSGGYAADVDPAFLSNSNHFAVW
ncbi:hypothetical protein ONS96_008636 [Cadophora gregata f. sp. sojae]|nr:hypothetical protein ONS96_008636 [Cadophora gregata f. sp. sojae]